MNGKKGIKKSGRNLSVHENRKVQHISLEFRECKTETGVTAQVYIGKQWLVTISWDEIDSFSSSLSVFLIEHSFSNKQTK